MKQYKQFDFGVPLASSNDERPHSLLVNMWPEHARGLIEYIERQLSQFPDGLVDMHFMGTLYATDYDAPGGIVKIEECKGQPRNGWK